MKSLKVNTLTLYSPDYPENLAQIPQPPAQLHLSGSAIDSWIDKPKVAIVGSRKASVYGRSITEKIAGELTSYGVVIISGLAYGIDAAAHRAAIIAGGITAAVLPTPLTSIYPAGHRQLAQDIIASGGTLISECGEGQEVYRANFLERNRIVSGLADAVVVTEAALKSGSLATARFGLDQGKTVMAVPGNITSPTSAGCNNLIKSGALPVTDTADILFALGLSPTVKSWQNFRGTAEQEQILKLIRDGVTEQEELSSASQLDGPALNSALTMLEIAGVIRAHGGGNWSAV